MAARYLPDVASAANEVRARSNRRRRSKPGQRDGMARRGQLLELDDVAVGVARARGADAEAEVLRGIGAV